MTNLIAGIRAKNQLAKDAFVQIINSCLTAIRNKYTDFYNAGKYLVEGFAAGITANTYMAEARARAMARAAAAAAEPRVPTALAIQEAGRQYAGDLSAQADRRRIVRFRFRVS
jgi:hypothetical protein